MKPILFRNLIAENESFHLQEDKLSHFYDFLHYHPELQLTLILKSRGSAFVGDNICSFVEGDVFLLGPNLPHVFRNTKSIYEDDGTSSVHALSVYFKMDSFGEKFFELPENHAIKDFLRKTSRGLKFQGGLKQELKYSILSLNEKEGFERLVHMLQLLNRLSGAESFDYISSVSFQQVKEETENKRIRQVSDFVMKNYRKDISLEEVAEVANMGVTSFCRFFKQRTRKTFTQFVNEVRIGHACKELMYTDCNISEIAYRCGFNNISNFNRQFKDITRFTPTEYSKKAG
ncbi:MAG: AraC family transcriptional regulator [Bacteroidia bacterium]